MNQHLDTFKHVGDVVFIAGLPVAFMHLELSDIYTTLGIIWLLFRIYEMKSFRALWHKSLAALRDLGR